MCDFLLALLRFLHIFLFGRRCCKNSGNCLRNSAYRTAISYPVLDKNVRVGRGVLGPWIAAGYACAVSMQCVGYNKNS